MEKSDKLCLFCNEIFDEKVIKNHIATIHLAIKPKELKAHDTKDAIDLRCYCGIIFTDRKSLQRHSQRKHRGWKYQCDNCGFSYVDKRSLLTHISQDPDCVNAEIIRTGPKAKTKSAEISEFKCHCGKEYYDGNNLRRHIKSAHQGLRFKCDICDKTYIDKRNLMKHCKKVHNSAKLIDE